MPTTDRSEPIPVPRSENMKEFPEDIRVAIIQGAATVAAAAISRDPGANEAIGRMDAAVTTAVNVLIKAVRA